MSIFAWFSSSQSALEQSIDDLTNKLDSAKYEIAAAQEELATCRKFIDNVKASAHHQNSCDVSFSTMNAFSIERSFNGQYQRYETIIGWFDPERCSHEWTIVCSQEAHEQLVARFNQYRAGLDK